MRAVADAPNLTRRGVNAVTASVAAAKATGKPVYVTENGIAADDDTRRVAFIDRALASVRACLNDGIDVRGFLNWSLLDNLSGRLDLLSDSA